MTAPGIEANRWEGLWAANWPLVIVISTVAVELATVIGADPLVRTPVVLWFCLVCTGMAWVRLLRLGQWLAEAVAAIALSVAVCGLAAAVFLYAGHWAPGWTLVLLEALTLAGVVLDPVVNRPPRTTRP